MKISVISLLAFFSVYATTGAAELKHGRVTQIIHNVQLLPEQTAPRPAMVNDEVRGNTAVRTGVDSRTELKFSDLTIARLGANTIFSVDEGSRTIDLGGGAVLVRVPKNSGGAKITTSAVTAAITGTTVMAEYHKDSIFKFIMLEGEARITRVGHPEEAVTLRGGEMLSGKPGEPLGKPVTVDAKRIAESSRLVQDFGPLGSEALMAQVFREQENARSAGADATNKNIEDIATDSGTEILNAIDQRIAVSSPPPDKFGALQTITSPNLSVIDSGTVIRTADPAITRSGETGFGKIYRGAAQDGPFATYLFGSTSAFDTAINVQPTDPNDLPIAVFKFQSLSLIGNPTIDLGNGGTTKLGLVAVDGITSGPPGGTLTFSGLDLLGLVTQAGSINLTSDISFQGVKELFIYARGAGSTLTLASPILGSDRVELNAEGSMQLTIGITAAERLKFVSGGDLVTTGPGGSAEFEVDNIGGTIAGTTGDRGNITLRVGGNLVSQSLSLLLANNAGGNIGGAGGNISVTTGGDLTTSGDATFTIQNTMGTIDDGGNIIVTSGGNTTIGGALTLLVDNSNGGHIGQADNISLNTADLTAGSLNVFINNRNGGSIASFANVACNILGNLTIAGDANIGTSNRNDGLGGGTMGTDSMVTVQANSISVGGLLAGFVSANAGGRIGNVGLLQLNVTGDIHSGGGTSLLVQSTGFNVVGGPFIAPGFIGSDAVLNVAAADLTSDGFIDAEVGEASGRIGRNATLNLNITGAISAPDIFFLVGGRSGQIGGDASLAVNAGSISASNTQFFQIVNANGGTISGNTSLNVGVTGGITAPDVEFFVGNRAGQIGGNASMVVNAGSISASTTGPFFQIVNADGGTIGGSATIDATTTNISGNALFVAILNSVNDGGANGTIGSNAAINFNVSGTSTVATDATFQINGSDSVAGTAAININGGTYSVGGTFEGFMDGKGTFTLNNATIAADTFKVGVFGTNGTIRIGGGTISADTILRLYAPGSNGSIDFVANVTLNSPSSATIIAANKVTIVNGVVVTIGGPDPAAVFTNIANYTGSGGNGSTTGMFGGSGAVTNPLSGAPPFDAPSSSGQLKLGTSDVLIPGRIEANKITGTSGAVPRAVRTVSRINPGPGQRGPIAAINLESSTQLLDLLEGEGPTTKKGKVILDAKRVTKTANGKGHATSGRGTGNARSGGDVKRSHDRAIESSGDSGEMTGHRRAGGLPSSPSATAIRPM